MRRCINDDLCIQDSLIKGASSTSPLLASKTGMASSFGNMLVSCIKLSLNASQEVVVMVDASRSC